MRTIVILLVGLALMAVFLGVAKAFAREKLGTAFTVLSVLWLAVAATNLWVGVTQAGYSFIEELPIFLLIAAVPIFAGYALLVRLRKS